MARRLPATLRDLNHIDRERLLYVRDQLEQTRERWRQSSALLHQVVRELHEDGCRTLDLANELGVTKQRVSQICSD